MTKTTPLSIQGVHENIYAGFWIRLGSILLDFIIILPVTLLILYANSLSLNTFYFTIIPGLLFHFWYSFYLVKRNGGTPGKLIAGIKILKINGEDVDWKEAILRQIVSFCITLFATIITIIAISKADGAYFERLPWIQKQQYLMGLTPVLFLVYRWVSNIWVYGELFVLLFNKRKRALHDFIAGTVIVRIKYIDKLREAMAKDENEQSV